jgi:2-oxoisovalerate dehydrogenase E1 component alpha subunit
MTDASTRVLGDDLEETDRLAPELRDRDLVGLYEALTLARLLDSHGEQMQQAGELGFWVGSGSAAAVSVAAAAALDEADWFYPSFRDAAAFLVRGGSVEKIAAQILGSADDLVKGRQVPNHGSLPGGRFVSVSASLATQFQHAAGTAVAMRLRGAPQVALAVTGAGAVGQPAFHLGLETAARHRAPAIFVVRGRESGAARRAEAIGLASEVVDGTDVLAIYKAVHDARERAVTAHMATLVEARIPASGAADARSRLRPYLEFRGAWDPGREEALTQRLEARIASALAAARAAGPPPAESVFDDVYAERTWVLEEQAEALGLSSSEAGDR